MEKSTQFHRVYGQTLINETKPAGTNEISFQPDNSFAPGFYLYSIKSGPFTSTKKMQLIR